VIANAGAVTACVSLTSPILCGSTCVSSPLLCASSCVMIVASSGDAGLELSANNCRFSFIRLTDTANVGWTTGRCPSNGASPHAFYWYSYCVCNLFGNINNATGNWTFGPNDCSACGYKLYVVGSAFSTCSVASPVLCATSGLTVCGVGANANNINTACATGCALVVSNGHASGGIGLLACTASASGFSGCFVGGSFTAVLSSTSQAFTICNVTTGSGTAAHILASGQLVCQSSTRASKCCIAPWQIPSDFLDRFEPARFLYRSGHNACAPFLVGALADDLAPWAPWAVRCDAHGNPATVSDTSLVVAALSGIKIERDERRAGEAALWSCICALELALAKAR
jgi:hypothetical protein